MAVDDVFRCYQNLKWFLGPWRLQKLEESVALLQSNTDDLYYHLLEETTLATFATLATDAALTHFAPPLRALNHIYDARTQLQLQQQLQLLAYLPAAAACQRSSHYYTARAHSVAEYDRFPSKLLHYFLKYLCKHSAKTILYRFLKS